MLDDQALIVNLRGKGLIVITGCGHAGVVNIGRYATQLTGGSPCTRSWAGSISMVRCSNRSSREFSPISLP